MKKFFFVALLILLKFNIFVAQTIDATLLEINFQESSSPNDMIRVGNKFFFSADDGIHGRELWGYDSVLKKAYLIKDIIKGSQSSLGGSSYYLVNNENLYFIASNGVDGYELWRSDGTDLGTYMVKDINPSGDGNINGLTGFNDKIVFSANDSANGQEVWISDGTTLGTVLLKDVYSGLNSSYPADFFIFNNLIYFVANNGINGNELWMTDGSSSGTKLLKDINIGGNAVRGGNKFIVFNNNFYFFADNGSSGFELWKSDGTGNGTQLLKDINVGLGSSSYKMTGCAALNYFVFSAFTNLGTEIWKSDGTVSGTELIKDINPDFSSITDIAPNFVEYRNKIYFVADDNLHGDELWMTDGTSTGTKIVKDIFPGSQSSGIKNITSTSNFLVFSAKNGLGNFNTLWRSDGSDSGTLEIKNVNLNGNGIAKLQFLECNNEIYFQGGKDSLSGIELWKTDGTYVNTNILVDLNRRFGSNTQSNSGDRFFTELNGKTVFVSNNGLGNEPFISDGTIEGTKMIKNLDSDEFSSIYADYDYSPSLTRVGDNIFFKANIGNGYELFKTDGTLANTGMVKDIRPGSSSSLKYDDYDIIVNFNKIAIFKANDGSNGYELWRSDGADAGTYMIKDINPGSGDAIRRLGNYNNKNEYAIVGNLLYFSAYDGVDRSIWRTDGTANGTVKVITIPSASTDGYGPIVLSSIGNKIFFITNSGHSSYGHQTLWVTDGTQLGCVNLGAWSVSSSHFKGVAVFDNELYFTIQASNGKALMKTDGTVSGTVLVKDNFNAPENFKYFNSCGNFLYFSFGQYGANDLQFWRTDGTTSGTIKLAENTNNNFLFSLSSFTCIDDNYIAYLQESLSNKIWVTDGNVNNTYSLTVNVLNGDDFLPNEGWVRTIGNYVNGKLYFTGVTAKSGAELYVADFANVLGVQEFSNNLGGYDINIFPNPTSNSVDFSSKIDLIIKEIDLYDFSGKLILSEKYNAGLTKFNLSGLGSGIYFAKIKTDKSTITKKIIKR